MKKFIIFSVLASIGALVWLVWQINETRKWEREAEEAVVDGRRALDLDDGEMGKLQVHLLWLRRESARAMMARKPFFADDRAMLRWLSSADAALAIYTESNPGVDITKSRLRPSALGGPAGG